MKKIYIVHKKTIKCSSLSISYAFCSSSSFNIACSFFTANLWAFYIIIHVSSEVLVQFWLTYLLVGLVELVHHSLLRGRGLDTTRCRPLTFYVVLLPYRGHYGVLVRHCPVMWSYSRPPHWDGIICLHHWSCHHCLMHSTWAMAKITLHVLQLRVSSPGLLQKLSFTTLSSIALFDMLAWATWAISCSCRWKGWPHGCSWTTNLFSCWWYNSEKVRLWSCT